MKNYYLTIFLSVLFLSGSLWASFPGEEFTISGPYQYPGGIVKLKNGNLYYTSFQNGAKDFAFRFVNAKGEVIQDHRFSDGNVGFIIYDHDLRRIFLALYRQDPKKSEVITYSESGIPISKTPIPTIRDSSNVQYMGNGRVFMQVHERDNNRVIPYLLSISGKLISGKPVPCVTTGGTSGQVGKINDETVLIHIACGDTRTIRFYNVNRMDRPYSVDFSGYLHCKMRGSVADNLTLSKCYTRERIDMWLFNQKGERVRKLFSHPDAWARIQVTPSADKRRLLTTVSKSGKIVMRDLNGKTLFTKEIEGSVFTSGFFEDGSFYVGQTFGSFEGAMLLTFYEDGRPRGKSPYYYSEGVNSENLDINPTSDMFVATCRRKNPKYYYSKPGSAIGNYLKVWDADAKVVYFREWPKNHSIRHYCIPDNKHMYLGLKVDGPIGKIIKEKL